MTVPSVRQSLQAIGRTFAEHGLEEPSFQASLLVAHVLGTDRGRLPLVYDQHLNRDQVSRLDSLATRRVRHEPLQYLLGSWSFLNLDLVVEPGALIPRPETGDVVEALIPLLTERFCSGRFAFVDVGTGTGAIGLALLDRFPGAVGLLADISPEALAVTRRNLANLQHLAIRSGLVQSDLLRAVKPGSVDLVISNPPYIRHADLPGLMPEVGAFEPSLALDGGEDGLAVIRRLLAETAPCLRGNGLVALEHGWDQREDILQLPAPRLRFLRKGDDLAGHPRYLVWEKSPE